MDAKSVTVEGVVGQQVVSRGSKSERDATVLTTNKGDTLVLRQFGAPAFGDHSFDELLGQTIRADGLLTNNTLIVKGWKAVR